MDRSGTLCNENNELGEKFASIKRQSGEKLNKQYEAWAMYPIML